MILPGRVVYARGILTNIQCIRTQIQPCGIDLSLKHILTLKSAGHIDFDNSRRQTSTSSLLPFDPVSKTNDEQQPPIEAQIQPSGIDLSLKHILKLLSAGHIDFNNSRRQTSTSLVPFHPVSKTNEEQQPSVHLQQGTYLVQFNELIRTPRDVMGQLFVRSSLFRSGVQIHAGIVDSGYTGVIGAMLKVENAAGLRVYRDARLAQIVFQMLSEPTEGYSGQYQGRAKI